MSGWQEELAEAREQLELGGLTTAEEVALTGLIERLERAAAGQHASDCAVHNEPALPAGPCDCAVVAAAPSPVELVVQDESSEEATETMSRRVLWDLLAELNSQEKGLTGEERRRVSGQRDRVFRMLYS